MTTSYYPFTKIILMELDLRDKLLSSIFQRRTLSRALFTATSVTALALPTLTQPATVPQQPPPQTKGDGDPGDPTSP